jgi:hypothetical protein
LITKWQTLNSSVEALAALAGELRLRRAELSGDSRVRALLQDVVRRIDPELLDDIDSWKPALALASKNLAQSGVAERVELRSQRAEHLNDKTIFTLAWLPGPFIAAEIVTLVLERIHRALTPGGWLIFGLHAPPTDALGQALANLRIVRSGGHPWTIREVEERLDTQGFERIEAFSPSPSITLVLGQRPDAPDCI